MDEKPDQIIGQIEAHRSELGRNLSELETRVRQTTDWHTYFDRNPMLMLGAALGGGLLLGSVVGGKTTHRTSASHRSSSYPKTYTNRQTTTSGATMGLASAGVAEKASHRSSSAAGSSSSSSSSLISPEHRHQMNQTVEHLKAALIAFGMSKAKEFLTQAIPGFDQHLGTAGQRYSRSHFADFGGSHHDEQQSGTTASQSQRDETGTGSQHGRTAGPESLRQDWPGSSETTGYRGSHSHGEPVGANSPRGL